MTERLLRHPDHTPSDESNGLLSIGYEVFEYRGGAPPYRGWHFGENKEIQVAPDTTWEAFCQAVKDAVDPSDDTDLAYTIYQEPFSHENERTLLDEDNISNLPDKNLKQIFIDERFHLRVYRPFNRGCSDIGTFEPVSTISHEAAYNNPTEECSLKIKESFSTEDISMIIRRIHGSTEPFEKQVQVIHSLASLNEQMFERLKSYANKVYEERKEQDLKITLSREKLLSLTGEETLNELDEVFGQRCEDIVLRRCSELNHCIDFHVDYARKTMQIAMNDDEDYVGGRLMYACEGQLHVPKRKRGTVTIHGNGVAHGVTALREGVRYGLLILDRPHSHVFVHE